MLSLCFFTLGVIFYLNFIKNKSPLSTSTSQAVLEVAWTLQEMVLCTCNAKNIVQYKCFQEESLGLNMMSH